MRSIALAPVLCLALATAAQAAPLHPDDPLRLLARLPNPDGGSPWQSSSYDRDGGNNDGFSGAYSVIREVTVDGQIEYVVMEAERPGVLGNIWFTGEVSPEPDRRIRFYFDGEEEPRIDLSLAEFFSGSIRPYLLPLVAPQNASSGGFVNAMVIPWEHSLVVTTTKVQRFFHFTYRTFDRLPPHYRTFEPERRAQVQRARPDVAANLKRPARIHFGADAAQPRTFAVDVLPGQSGTLAELVGSGLIGRMALRVKTLDPDNLRRSMLKIYWDGEASPSVEAPIGDFFGCPFGLQFFQSVALGATTDGFYCNWPMPYGRSARIVIDNGSAWSALRVAADLTILDDPLHGGHDALRFHAKWHRAVTQAGKPHTIVTATGRGHFVGTLLCMDGENFNYLEGDEQIYVDGSEEVCIHGTGTEDYFNGGWYFNHGPFQLPYHGLTVHDRDAGRIAAYRLHLPDLIPFARDIRVDIEHGGGNDMPGVDYASVALWYQTEPHGEPFRMPVAWEIVPRLKPVPPPPNTIEAESLADRAELYGPELVVRSWNEVDPGYGAGHQLFFPTARPSQWFTLPVAVPRDDRYQLSVGYSVGPRYGAFEILVDGQRTRDLPIDAQAAVFEPNRRIDLAPVRVADGTAEIMFRTARTEQLRRSTGIGLDYLSLVSASPFVRTWNVLGPFDLYQLEDVGAPLVAEKPIEFYAQYPGRGGRTVRWQTMEAQPDGRLDLDALAPGEDDVLALCHVSIYADRLYRTTLLFGSDDAAVVRLNGETIHEVLARRGCVPDQDAVPIVLHQGWNHLLVKVGDVNQAWQICARIVDPEGILHTSVAPE